MDMNFNELGPYAILTHAIKHLINAEPASLADVTIADDTAIAILMECKQLIRSEYRLRAFARGMQEQG